jgi:ATP-binding cassette subfamily B protein RaxB
MDNLVSLLEFTRLRRLPLILQTEAAECGLACLAMISGFYGYRTDLLVLRRRFSISLKGVTLENLISIADQLHLTARPLQVDLNELNQLQTPAILHWDLDHFVVLKKVTARSFKIHDPARGELKINVSEVSKHFTGVAMELTPNKTFEKKEDEANMPLSDFWSQIGGLKRILIQIFVLSMLLQIFALASPFFMQIVMDDIIINQDINLLGIVAAGFFMLAMIGQATSVLRSLVSLHLTNQLSVQMTSNLFRHMLRLPLGFFESRHLGDVVSRFSSLGSIQSLLTTGLISVVLDGFMAVTTLIMMFVYLPMLAWFVIAIVILYALIRAVSYVPFRRLNEEQIIANAREDSTFMESIRAIQSIKVFGKETQRQTLWHNHYANSVNTGIKTAKMSLVFSVINGVLFTSENIIVIYLGATAVISGDITVGMFLAFIAYKNQFTGKATALISAAIAYKMLSLHLIRVADIAMTEIEPGLDENQSQINLDGDLILKKVSFRYDVSQPYLFEEISVCIKRGESIAIIGSSGCGKSTLVKVMLGLLAPSKGEILLGINKVNGSNVISYRNQVAAVMQDDQLLSGSLAENISFFEPSPDNEWIEECGRLACIHGVSEPCW